MAVLITGRDSAKFTSAAPAWILNWSHNFLSLGWNDSRKVGDLKEGNSGLTIHVALSRQSTIDCSKKENTQTDSLAQFVAALLPEQVLMKLSGRLIYFLHHHQLRACVNEFQRKELETLGHKWEYNNMAHCCVGEGFLRRKQSFKMPWKLREIRHLCIYCKCIFYSIFERAPTSWLLAGAGPQQTPVSCGLRSA